jgi:hypothetical protein
MTMKSAAQWLCSATGILFCFALAGQITFVPLPAAAFTSDFDEHDDHDDFDSDLTILQLQREAISSQEEQAREAGRARRRDEVDQMQESQSIERQEYFQSVLEASQAALRAPRGAYYRKPGDTSQEAPADAQTVEVGGIGYLYDRGLFWLLPGPPFIVVVAPYGAVVDRLPAGAYRIFSKQAPRYYYFGIFFEERSGKFEVIKPPAGTLVSYLPDGYQQEQSQGTTLYTVGPTSFKPVFVQGVVVYQVVER